MAKRALEGDESIGDDLITSGVSLLVLPEKSMLLRPSGRGGSIGGLALEFEQDSTCITRMYTCMHAFPRSCIFVGDILLAVDNKEVHCAADLIEVLEELPAGAPITLMLRQPALRTALKERLTEKVRFAAWVKLQLPPGSALAASGSQGGGKETEHGAKVDSKLTEKRKAARLDEVCCSANLLH